MTPPKLLPAAANPTASPNLARKYVGKIATLGTNSKPPPIPMQKPWARTACQSEVQRDVIMYPNTIMKLPEMRRMRR